ncbi:MAG: hypothetical protein GY866_09500 [Proteobacteria bacterium]|nr:hypothetical protein [Pseudomonadota bacterium]
MIVVQDVLGPHFYRKEIQAFHSEGDCASGNSFYKNMLPHGLPTYEFLVLAPEVSHYGISDLRRCMDDMESAKGFKKVPGYEHLVVFERIL